MFDIHPRKCNFIIINVMFISFLIKEKHNFKIECKSTTYIYGPETTDVTSGGDGKKGVRAVYMPNVRD